MIKYKYQAWHHRHPDVQAVVDATSPSLLGQAKSAELEVCATCAKPLKPFRNEISAREYGISGMCQCCQDSIFGRD